MTSLATISCAVLAVSIPVTYFAMNRSEWLRPFGIGVVQSAEGNVASPSRPLSDVELKTNRGLINQRIALRNTLAQELIDNRITLPMATEHFLTMNRHDPDTMTTIRLAFPGKNDEESTALQVIQYVKNRLRHFHTEPQKADLGTAVVQRLESEFTEMKKATPVEIAHEEQF